MDQWDRELAKAGIQMAGAAAKGMGNVMAAVMDGLIEKGVFSIEEVRDMLDRLEVAVNLTATIEAGDGYTVGMPGSATVRMVVADPAITVRPERAAYRFAEGGAEATIAVVARTAPDVPPPDGTFPMQVFSDHTSGTATVGDDYEVLRTNVVFGTADFTAAGDVWEARKEVSLKIVDDDVAEADETIELRLRPDPPFTPERIRPRNADGSACVDDVCTVSVTIAANDGPPVEVLADDHDESFETM